MILVVALLVFGPNRLPEVGRQVGRGVRELRKFQQTHQARPRRRASPTTSPTAPSRRPTLPPKAADAARRPATPDAERRRRRPSAESSPDAARREPRRRRRPTRRSPCPGRTDRRPDDGRRAPHRAPPPAHDLARRGRRSPRSSATSSRPTIIRWFLDFYRDAHRRARANAFIFTGPARRFVTRLKVATYGGIVLALPVWLWQLWRFITPGLNPKEKRYAVPFVICVDRAVRCSAACVALLTLPQALDFLLNAGGQELKPLLTADKYLALVSLMIVAFGLAFEFPVRARVPAASPGCSPPRSSRSCRRWAIVLDLRLRRGDHPEPGPVLSVLHGDPDVPLLRGVAS